MLASNGWRLFAAYVESEWGSAAYRRHVRSALSGVTAGPHQNEVANQTVLQIEATMNVVEHVMAWPKERLTQLQREGQPETFRRGGY